jgi:hypothetical protein
VERDPAGVAPHHLEQHHAVMALRRVAQAVERVGRGPIAVQKPKV